MLRFLCPLYANKSHQWHILLRITGYKKGGTRLVTRYVATVRHWPRGTRVTVLTCLTPHTVNVLCVLFIFCHCWLTRMAPQQMVQVSLTRVYIVPQDHCTGVYIGWWCGRGEGGPGTDPVLTAAARPSAHCRTTALSAAAAGYILTSHSGKCPTSTLLQSTVLC